MPRVLALVALFLVLISFSTSIYLFLPHPASFLSYYHQFLSSFSTPHSEIPPAGKSQLIEFLQSPFTPFFYLYLIIYITRRTTTNEFHNWIIKFVSSLKSILVSFSPILSPKLAQMIILGLILFAFGILMLLQYIMLVLLGCNMGYNSIYFLVFIFRIAALFAGLLIYFGVEWCSMNQISLKYLVMGMRGVAFLMVMLSAFLSGILSVWYMVMMGNYSGNNFHGPTGSLVVQILVYAVFLVTLLSCNHVVETVFLHLLHGVIALRGDATSQIDEKLDGETVC
ncbi:hypothetical protein ACS0TY_009947 [Phlomoides rotata]